MNQNIQNIEELLQSDDEFPMDYCETPSTPAYLMENRFDVIQFKWINKTNVSTSNTESNMFNVVKTPYQSIFSKLHHAPVLKKGVLHKQDLFCIKSIEGLTGESTFIWLINFLIFKDVQANYLFLKSCLVSSN